MCKIIYRNFEICKITGSRKSGTDLIIIAGSSTNQPETGTGSITGMKNIRIASVVSVLCDEIPACAGMTREKKVSLLNKFVRKECSVNHCVSSRSSMINFLTTGERSCSQREPFWTNFLFQFITVQTCFLPAERNPVFPR